MMETRNDNIRQKKARSISNSIHCAIFFALFLVLIVFAPPARAFSDVPFVGCPNVLGYKPIGKPLRLDVPERIASELALYSGAYIDILAPRGWTCFANYGNVNDNIWVYPKGSNPNSGPTVSMSVIITAFGGGRQARVIYGGRYFPKIVAERDVKNAIIAYNSSSGENISEDQFLAPEFPGDKITYLNGSTLEFWTPPNQYGLASTFAADPLQKIDQTRPSLPTSGLMELNSDAESDLVQVAIRVPTRLNDLVPFILGFSRDCLAHSKEMSICVSSDDYSRVKN